MTIATQASLNIIALPSLSEVGSDVLHVIGATPIALSPNGVELLVAVSVNSSTSGQKTEYLLCNTRTGLYTRNLSDEIGLGDSTTVNITAVDAVWVAGEIVVAAAYEDLLTGSFTSGYSNRVGLLKADASFLVDVIETTTGEVANGAVTALRLGSLGNRIAVETSASNLLVDASDANDSSDLYLLDLNTTTATRVSVLADGTELSSGAYLIDFIESTNGELGVAFETLGSEFAADDPNATNDIYVANNGAITLVSQDNSGTAQGAMANDALVYHGKTYYVSRSSNITDDDYDADADIFVFNNDTNQRVSTALDHLSIGSNFEVALVNIISDTDLVISVQDATLNGVEVSGQLLSLNTQANTLTLLSMDANGNAGDDVSVSYFSAEDNRQAYIYQTYATNIGGYEVPAMVTNIALPTTPVVASAIADATASEDSVYSYDASANFSDADGDTLTYTATLSNGNALPVWLDISTNGTLSGTPSNGDVGAIAVKVTATDPLSASVSDTYTLTINNTNDAPTITTSRSLTTNEDTATAATVFSGSDIDGDTLTFSFSDPAKGSVVDNGDGTFAYTPDANANGSDSFKITVNDGTVDVTETVNVAIAAVNDAPTIATSTSLSTAEDTATAATVFSGSDIDGDTLTFSFSDPAKGSVVDNGDGTFAYTPDANANGSDSFTITANDGTVDVTETVNVAIAAVDDFPNGAVTISGASIQGNTLTAVTSTISDEDGLGEFSYQWFSDDVLIVEASDSILKLSQSEVDKVIAVKVNYTDGYGKVEELMSSDSDAVVNVNDAPYGFVTISGTAIEGNTLTADTSRLSDKDGLGEFSYQWFADDVEIPNATESTFILNQSEVDKAITVKVSYTDSYGTAEEFISSTSNLITTTIADHFGNAMNSAKAQAYEDSVNEITATSTTGNVTVFETASGSDLLIDAAMAIDTASDKAIGAFDALQALRLAVGLDKSDGTSEWYDYIAADINKDGRVGADDALNILKFAVGLTDGPSADWVFLDGDADYSAIDRKNTDYDEGTLISDVMTDLSINMTGILVGDVDGSYLG